MKSKFALLLILFVTYSCKSYEPDPELIMKRLPYNGNKIRLDGFYFSNRPNYTSYMFFYSNGIVFTRSGMDNKIVEINDILKDMEFVREHKDRWKIFQINNDTLHLHGWENTGSGFIGPIQVHSLNDEYYKILNDSTLLFIKHTGYYNYTSDNNKYFYFKKCFPKPDSTNVFIN